MPGVAAGSEAGLRATTTRVLVQHDLTPRSKITRNESDVLKFTWKIHTARCLFSLYECTESCLAKSCARSCATVSVQILLW